MDFEDIGYWNMYESKGEYFVLVKRNAGSSGRLIGDENVKNVKVKLQIRHERFEGKHISLWEIKTLSMLLRKHKFWPN